ncbi:MAG: prolyl oligopeptidase family serine peptidase [Planctomycetota bacterium]
MIKPTAFLAALLMSLGAPASSQESSEHTLEVSGIKRHFVAYVPELYQAGGPAVVLLHGAGGSMHSILDPESASLGLWTQLAQDQGVLLLVPNGLDRRGRNGGGRRQLWNHNVRGNDDPVHGDDDVEFLERVVQWARKNHGCDALRIHVCGTSNGGMMALRVLAERPGIFASAVAFCATLPGTPITKPQQGTPLMMVNGTADRLVPFEGLKAGRRRMRSVPDTVKFWVEANVGDPARAVEEAMPDHDADDGCQAIKTTYPVRDSDRPAVVLVRIDGGGHTIPDNREVRHSRMSSRVRGARCRDFRGVELAWSFMQEVAPPNPESADPDEESH